MSTGPYSVSDLRRGAWYYLSGRAASGVLTFVIQLSLVRLLSIENYGAYATLVAAMEISLVVAAFGLNWVAARYIPEYRISASPAQIRSYVTRLIRYRTLALVVAGLVWVLGAHLALGWTALEVSRASVLVVSAMLVVEGLGMFLRDGVLGPLLMQRVVRASYIARQLCWLALLGVAAWSENRTIEAVLLAEVAAAAVGSAIAARGVWSGLRSTATRGASAPLEAPWREPPASEMWGMSRRIYVSDLLNIATSPQIFVVMLQRYSGSDAAAIFGFLRVMLAQLSRYLPANLLFSLIQPKLVASYVEGGMSAVTRHANFAGKMSLLVIIPLLAFCAHEGELVVNVLSGGQFQNTGLLMFTAMLATVPGSQGLLLYTVSIISRNSVFCTVAASVNLVVLPLIWLLASQYNMGAWAGVVSMCASMTLPFLVLTTLLSIRTDYRIEWIYFLRIILAGLVAWFLGFLMLDGNNQLIRVLVVASVTISAYAAVLWFFNPLSLEERKNINIILGRKVFAL